LKSKIKNSQCNLNDNQNSVECGISNEIGSVGYINGGVYSLKDCESINYEHGLFS
jgi:hypothetical protein